MDDFPESELIESICIRCKGTGSINEPGFFTGTTTGKQIKCDACDGKGKFKRRPTCHYSLSHWTKQCIGYECMLWDRINKGGCLDKKSKIQHSF